jgi:hypothetical protein
MGIETKVKSDIEELHNAVEEAYNEVTAETGSVPELQPNEPPDEGAPEVLADEPQLGERARNPKTGKFLPREEEIAPLAPAKVVKPAVVPPGTAPTKPQRAPQPLTPPPPSADPLARPPQSWRPQARTAYAALDKLGPEGRVLREELHRREREVTITLQSTKEARSFHEEFQRVIQPFAPVIAANGHTPLQSVQGLMQTAAALQMGPPGQKALIAATIIKNYSIDVDMLAQALETGGVPQVPQGAQGYDPRVDQLIAQQQQQAYYDQQRQAQEAQRVQETLTKHYEQFGETHEFFEEIRPVMATIVSVKMEQEGVDISDEEAYKMALALRPDLTEYIRQREALAQATKPDGSTARARAASVSLTPGTTITTPKSADPNDLHAVLAESLDEVMGK